MRNAGRLEPQGIRLLLVSYICLRKFTYIRKQGVCTPAAGSAGRAFRNSGGLANTTKKTPL